MPRKRRIRRKLPVRSPQIFTTINTFSITFGERVTFTQTELEILKDRNYRPLWFKVTATSEAHPSALQVRLYSDTGRACFTSDLVLVPVGQTKVVLCRWPRQTSWFADNLPSTTVATIQSPCLSKSQQGGILSIVSHCAVVFGPDIDSRECKQIPSANISRIEDSFEKMGL